MAKQVELKYYKGEKSNPFEEVNEKQGAWCQRYNAVASILWWFEYHWTNGWEAYRKLEEQHPSYYFELHKEPQKEFESLEDALAVFVFESHLHYPLHNVSSRAWQQYIYQNAWHERFYKGVYNVLPKEDVPAYLLYYHGEGADPYQYRSDTRGAAKSFWWGFEMAWYTSNNKHSKERFEEHLHGYLMRNSENHTTASEAYHQELKEQLEHYKSWLQ